MRLRNNIAAPARFEDDYHNHRYPSDPTKPAFPALLAKATAPYNPSLPNVAWKTRSFDLSHSDACQAPQLEATCAIVQQDCSNTVAAIDTTSTRIREQNLKLAAGGNATLPFERDFISEMDTSSESEEDESKQPPKALAWSGLSLSLQLHIYVNLRCLMSKNAAACKLGLHEEELETMESHRSFRRIHKFDEDKFRAMWLSHLLAIQRREDPSLRELTGNDTSGNKWTQANKQYMTHMVHHCNYAYASDAQINQAITYLQQHSLDLDLVGTWLEGSESQGKHRTSQNPWIRMNTKSPSSSIDRSATLQNLIQYNRENATEAREESHLLPADVVEIVTRPLCHVDKPPPADSQTGQFGRTDPIQPRSTRDTSSDATTLTNFHLEYSLPRNVLHKIVHGTPHGLKQAAFLRGGGTNDWTDFQRFKQRELGIELKEEKSTNRAAPTQVESDDLACIKCGKTMEEGVTHWELTSTWYKCDLCGDEEHNAARKSKAKKPTIPKLKIKSTGEAVIRKSKRVKRQETFETLMNGSLQHPGKVAAGEEVEFGLVIGITKEGQLIYSEEQPDEFEREILQKNIDAGNFFKPPHLQLRLAKSQTPRSRLKPPGVFPKGSLLNSIGASSSLPTPSLLPNIRTEFSGVSREPSLKSASFASPLPGIGTTTSSDTLWKPLPGQTPPESSLAEPHPSLLSTPVIFGHDEPRAPSWSPITPPAGNSRRRFIQDRNPDAAEYQHFGGGNESLLVRMRGGDLASASLSLGESMISKLEGPNFDHKSYQISRAGPNESTRSLDQEATSETVTAISINSKKARENESKRMMTASIKASAEHSSFPVTMFGILIPAVPSTSMQSSFEDHLNSRPGFLRSIPSSPPDQHVNLVDSGLGTSRATSAEPEMPGGTLVQKTLDGASKKLTRGLAHGHRHCRSNDLKAISRLAIVTQPPLPLPSSPASESQQWQAYTANNPPSLPLVSNLKMDDQKRRGGKGPRGPYKRTREKMAKQAAEKAAAAQTLSQSLGLSAVEES